MKVQIKLLNDYIQLPNYQTGHSAAMDLYAAICEPLILQPMQRLLIPCGFSIVLPKGYEAQIRARSGLSLKHGICLANGIGTIDADYRGEIQVLLINLGAEDYKIEPKERVAQMVVAKYEKITWETKNELPSSDRNKNGFGSTGKF